MWTQLSKIEDYPTYLNEMWEKHLDPRDIDAPTVISLFAGCGGSSLGYSMAGYNKLLAAEWDENSIETFKLNFPNTPIYPGDINELSVEKVLEITGLKPGELDLLDGSPPCQGFSMAGNREFDDHRNLLYLEYIRLLKGLQPKAFILENVMGMVRGKMKLIFVEILKGLKEAGYVVAARKLNSKWFGVPQSRNRLIFIGIRKDLGIDYVPYPVPETIPVRTRQAIGHLLPNNDPGLDLNPSTEPYYARMKPGESASKYHPKGNMFGTIKLHPEKPCPTIIQSAGTGLVHWKYPRFLSSEEILILSSFPSGWKTTGIRRNILDRVGNSVPPLFMEAIARHVKNNILLTN